MTTWDIAAGIIIGGAVLSLFAAGVRCFAVDRAILAVLFMLAARGWPLGYCLKQVLWCPYSGRR